MLLAFSVGCAIASAGCSTVNFDAPRAPSQALEGGSATPLGRAVADDLAQHPGQSGFFLLTSGHAALVARAALADVAGQTLDLQYYSVDDDVTTDLLLQRLGSAAERGARVRVLLDDVRPSARQFARKAVGLHSNIQVRLFNPFLSTGISPVGRVREFVLDSGLNRRMHNKLWVADNTVAIFGSRNLGDEYFDTDTEASFLDVDALATGPIVQEMSRGFDQYWNSLAAWPIEAFGKAPDEEERRAVRNSLRERQASCGAMPACKWVANSMVGSALLAGQVSFAWASATLAYDPPDLPKLKVPSGIAHGHQEHVQEGFRGELLIVSPYLIPGEEGLEHVKVMRSRGDRIAVLSNSLASTDSVAAHAGYAAQRPDLLRHGVELYELRPMPGARHRSLHLWGPVSPASLHAKFVVHDRRRVVLGSRNQDPRSRLHNTEAWVTIDSVELANELAAFFEEGTQPQHSYKVEFQGSRERLSWLTEEEGIRARHASEPRAGFWLRVWRGVLSVLIPEHML